MDIRKVASLALCAGATLVAGCGRHATQSDCQLIVDKSVELRMKALSHNDQSAITKREEHVRAELGDAMRSCESRHVTDQTMACIRAATTAEDLETCFR